MSVAALIPARGGSKRLPRKNILPVAGRPILGHSIELARKSQLFETVFVSTEDREIATIAQSEGARVINRPPELAKDHSTVVEVCLHTLESFPHISVLCCIYATAFLLHPETLVESYTLLNDPPPADFVMGVSEFVYPPMQALKIQENGFLKYMWPEWQNIQSQFYPILKVSNGTFYWARRESLIKERTFYGMRLRGFHVPDSQVSDINTSEDLKEAKLKHKNIRNYEK
jgi:pseudaminic acid cytidylyltransferase